MPVGRDGRVVSVRRKLAEEADEILKDARYASRRKEDDEDDALNDPRHATSRYESSRVGKRPKHIFNLKGVAEVLIEHKLNPTEEILRVLPELDADVKARILAELLQYVQPKLKSIEHSGTVTSVTMTEEERKARLAELAAKIKQ